MVAVAISGTDFEAAVEGDELRLRGTADGRSAERLEDLINRTHRALLARRATTFRIDLREVALMSDSCFNVFVAWIGQIQMLPAAERYQLAFAIDPGTAWQRRSVVTMSSVAADVVKLDS